MQAFGGHLLSFCQGFPGVGFGWALGGLREFFIRSLRYFFIDSPRGGHLVGIGWASGEVCISLSMLLNGALGILVPCWWWLV